MQKQNRRKPQVIDATQAAYTTFGVGVVKGNPRKCIKCGKRIKHGESWRKDTSATASKRSRYSVIRHSRCEGASG